MFKLDRKHEMGGALIVTQWKEKRDVSIVCVCVRERERERERGGGGEFRLLCDGKCLPPKIITQKFMHAKQLLQNKLNVRLLTNHIT